MHTSKKFQIYNEVVGYVYHVLYISYIVKPEAHRIDKFFKRRAKEKFSFEKVVFPITVNAS